jgi:hypothetical protein
MSIIKVILYRYNELIHLEINSNFKLTEYDTSPNVSFIGLGL